MGKKAEVEKRKAESLKKMKLGDGSWELGGNLCASRRPGKSVPLPVSQLSHF
jgi:hypothetical protein